MKEIYVSKDICKRIRNAKDLSDLYAYCERDYTYEDFLGEIELDEDEASEEEM